MDIVISGYRHPTRVSGYEIEVRQLLPDRQNMSQRIDQNRYRVELLVTR